MSRRITDQATEVVTAAGYRTPEWYAARRTRVTASEIGVILGLSNWDSPFNLWYAKRDGEGGDGDNRDTRRGRRYEHLVVEDFTEEHPEFVVVKPGLCVNVDRPWQACTPDGLAFENTGVTEHDDGTFTGVAMSDPVATVEAKTAARRDEWGEPGTDDIPPLYRAQVLWQLDTFGLEVAFVPVVFGFDYREYVVEYDEADVKLMRDTAQEFLASIAAGRQPDIDAHKATSRRLKRLHPSLADDQAEVNGYAVRQYHAAKRLRDCAEARMRLAENRIRAQLGNNRTATVDGRKVATRSVTEIKERTQTVRAHTRNTIHFTKPQED